MENAGQGIPQNPWEILTPDLLKLKEQQMKERRNSGINQNLLEDRQLNFGQPDFTSHPFWPRKMNVRCKKSERQSSANSSNSSWTEEIFHNALENKGPKDSPVTSPSKEAFPVDSRNISFATITCDRNLQFDST